MNTKKKWILVGGASALGLSLIGAGAVHAANSLQFEDTPGISMGVPGFVSSTSDLGTQILDSTGAQTPSVATPLSVQTPGSVVTPSATTPVSVNTPASPKSPASPKTPASPVSAKSAASANSAASSD